MKADLLITGGTIVDGSGGEPFTGDVAMQGDRIVYVGPAFSGQAAETIDATGRIVTPGFVDIHTHYDGQAIWSEEMSPSSSHGVTTVVLGNCGVGFAPCRTEDHEALIHLMEGVEDIPDVVMANGLDWSWETFPQYLDALQSRPRDINVAALLPHNPLRVYVMGERALRREPATDEDLARMKELAREAIDAGAIGFATSRQLIHRSKAGDKIPSYDAEDRELQAIASALKDAGKGILQMVLDVPHATWPEEMAHLMSVVESSGRPATFTIGLTNEGELNSDEMFDIVDDANARGYKVHPQILPRPVGMISGFELSTSPFSLCPSFIAIANLPLAEKLTYLRDPEFRARLIAESPQEGQPLAMMTRNWNWTFPFGDPPQYEPAAETSIGAQARATGRKPEEIAYDVLMGPNNDGRGMLLNTLGNFHNARLDALLPAMRREDTVMGLGDGGAHYSAICDASYPTFLLTYWVRDRAGERLSLAEGVRALASKPARVAGLDDRGVLAPGYKADVNVIDMDALRLHAPIVRYDLPGKGRRLDQEATGFVATVCNGKVIRRNDRATGARPGQVVRGQQQAAVAVPA